MEAATRPMLLAIELTRKEGHCQFGRDTSRLSLSKTEGEEPPQAISHGNKDALSRPPQNLCPLPLN